MADFAVNLIEDFDNIIIESSNLCEPMVKKIPKELQIKIFTNCPVFVANIDKDSKWQCNVPEGEVDNEDLSIFGPRTTDFFKSILVDKAFISIQNLNNNSDFYSPSYGKKDITKSILQSSKKVIAMYRFSENEPALSYKVDNLDAVDILIIGGMIDKKALDKIRSNAKNTEIYTVA